MRRRRVLALRLQIQARILGQTLPNSFIQILFFKVGQPLRYVSIGKILPLSEQ